MKNEFTLIGFLNGESFIKIRKENDFRKIVRFFKDMRIEGSRLLSSIEFEFFQEQGGCLSYTTQKMCFSLRHREEYSDNQTIYEADEFINRFIKKKSLIEAVDSISNLGFQSAELFAAYEIHEMHPELSNLEVTERVALVVECYLHSDENNLPGLCEFIHTHWPSIKDLSKNKILDQFHGIENDLLLWNYQEFEHE